MYVKYMTRINEMSVVVTSTYFAPYMGDGGKIKLTNAESNCT